MRRREFVNLAGVLAGACLPWPKPLAAQQPGQVRRIGYLAPAELLPRGEVFQQRLRELGYVDGQNIFIEYLSAEGSLDRLPALARELVGLKVDASSR